MTTSVGSGLWSNPNTWSNGVPDASKQAVIATGHAVRIDAANQNAGGVIVQGTLQADETTSNPAITGEQKLKVYFDGGYAGSTRGSQLWQHANVALGAVWGDTLTPTGVARNAGSHFDGQIDTVLSYNRTLVWDEIKALHAAGRGSIGSVSQQDLGALWRFDGNTNDTSTTDTRNDWGTRRGGAAFSGNALVLDGINDVVTIADSAELNLGTKAQRTISVWFYADDTSGRQFIYEEGGGGRGLNVFLDGDTLYAGGWNTPGSESNWQGDWVAVPGVTANQWHHVVLTLDGRAPDPNREVKLATDWLFATEGGQFRVGTPSDPYEHNFTLELTGDDNSFDLNLTQYSAMGGVIQNNNAFLMARGAGAAIDLHAADAAKESWTQLRSTAVAGATRLLLSERTGWEVGDRIAIASTDYDLNQAEEFTVAAVSNGGRDITVDRPLQFMHYGEIETYDNGKTGSQFRRWDIDMRAEVALLSRNVTITGDENASTDRYGGHLMVMPGADLRISGAEFKKMGQEGLLGRYGAHWHLTGNSTGDYIANSSFHEIYNKGITLHAVQNVTLDNNVVVETIGHSIFTENAAEFGNSITNNLVFGTRAASSDATAVTTADLLHPSSFWIENPDNIIRNNRAAGSEHAGFWFAPSDVHGEAKASGQYAGYSAKNAPIQNFTGNTGHSNFFTNFAIEGEVVDGPDGRATFRTAQYKSSTGQWSIDDFTSFRSTDRGLWTLAEQGDLTNVKSADNGRGTFFAYSQTMRDSVIVGISGNVGNPQTSSEIAEGISRPKAANGNLRGHSFYDGPSGIENVHFAGFNTEQDYAMQRNGAAIKSGSHFVSGLTFDGDVLEDHKVDLSDAVEEFSWATGVYDLDGSLTGQPGAVLTPIMAAPQSAGSTINASPNAIRRDDWGAWINPAGFETFKLIINDDFASFQAPRYNLIRSDGEASFDNRETLGAHFQPTLIEGYEYEVQFQQLPGQINLTTIEMRQGASTIIKLANLGSGATVSGAAAVSSLQQLRSATTTSYFKDAGNVYAKIVGNNIFFGDLKRHNTDHPLLQNHAFGDNLTITTNATAYDDPVIADFDSGIDSRGFTAAAYAAISSVQTGWNDRSDAVNWWDVRANGDGVFGFGDFHLDLEETDLRGFDNLTLRTTMGGKDVGYQLYLRDRDQGYRYLGRQSEGLARIDLNEIPDDYLDDVIDILVRVLETDLTSDVSDSSSTTRIHLHSIELEMGDQPLVADFEDGIDPKGATAALYANISSVNNSGNFQGEGINWWDIRANGDGVFGIGDYHLKFSNEDWRGNDWLIVDAVLGGVQSGYELILQDADDGQISLGRFQSGNAWVNLRTIDQRYLDKVNDLIIRVNERDITSDPNNTTALTRVHLKSIDFRQGDPVFFDRSARIDSGLSISSVSASIAGPVYRESDVWFDIRTDGDGTFGYAQIEMNFDSMSLQSFSTLELDTFIQGRDIGYDLYIRDTNGGLTKVGDLSGGVRSVDLNTINRNVLDSAAGLVIRFNESELASSATNAGTLSRFFLRSVRLLG